MQETLRLLRGLQELDQDLYRVKDELRRLPEERQRRRAGIDGLSGQVSELDRRLQEKRAVVKEIEDMSTIKRQRLRKLEGEAATARDASLLAHYQVEIRTIKRELNQGDDDGLTTLEEIEGLTKQREELVAQVELLEGDFRDYASNVDRELADAETRKRGLDEERQKRMTGPVNPEILDTYEKLLGAREGQAIAALEGRICQGCYVTVPSNIYVRLARALDLVVCPSCGRILFLPEPV